jgi:GT2 family glycosyltransferase
MHITTNITQSVKKLAIILVNYKSEEQTISYVLNELSKIAIPNIIVIVNNSATNESNIHLQNKLKAELIEDIFETPQTVGPFIIPHKQNLGYAKGNNLGAEFSIRHFNIEKFLFSNNDLRFIEDQTVERLYHKLNTLDSSIAAIGPSVIGLNGEKQSPIIYLTFFTKWFLGLWYTPFLSEKQRIRFYKCDRGNLPEGIYYTLMGSFLLIRAKPFIECGMFDPNTFLFAEEAILSERLSRIGNKMYYYPQINILHAHSVIINKYNSPFKRQKLIFDSDVYYYKTYKNVSKLTIWFCWITIKIHFHLKNLKGKI